MTEKKNKEYYDTCVRKIDKLFGELFESMTFPCETSCRPRWMSAERWR